MTHIASGPMLPSDIRSSMHPRPGNWLANSIMPGLPVLIVQELNVGIVGPQSYKTQLFYFPMFSFALIPTITSNPSLMFQGTGVLWLK